MPQPQIQAKENSTNTPVVLTMQPQGDIRPYYDSRFIWRLSVAQITLGALAIGFQIWDCVNGSAMSGVGTGIWTGFFFVLAGGIGVLSSKLKTRCSMIGFMMMSFLALMLSIPLLTLSSINLRIYRWTDNERGYLEQATLALTSLQILVAIAEGIIAIISSWYACYECCNKPKEQMQNVQASVAVQVTNGSGQMEVTDTLGARYLLVPIGQASSGYDNPLVVAGLPSEHLGAGQPQPSQPEYTLPPAYSQEDETQREMEKKINI